MKRVYFLLFFFVLNSSCRSRVVPSADLATYDNNSTHGLVRVSSTFKSDDGKEKLHLTGYGFLVKVPGTFLRSSAMFVITASHLSQGVNDLKIETKINGQTVQLEPINRLASIRRDIEVIHIKPVPGLEPLAVVTNDSRLPIEIRKANPFGWLEVVHPQVIKSLADENLNADNLYPIGLLTSVPQTSFVRKVIESPLSKFRSTELRGLIEQSSDPWRQQMLRLGYEMVIDEIETYRKLPAGFSGAPLFYRVGKINTVLGLVTSYSRAFNLSWGLPSHFITRTINLYMTQVMGQPPSKIGVLTNTEAWKLRRGLLYRVGNYEANEFGGAKFSEVTLANLPAGDGGSSSPGGDGGSSSPGGDGGSSSPGGGDGTYNFDIDPMTTYGIQYGLDFSAPTITGNQLKDVLGFKFDLQFQGVRSEVFVQGSMSSLNPILNSLAPDYVQNPNNPQLAVTAVSDYQQWCAAVREHLIRSGFKQSGFIFTNEAKLVSKDPAAKTQVRPLKLAVQFRNKEMTQLVIESTLDGKVYVSEMIDNRDKLRPFIKQTSKDGGALYITLAGVLTQDTSVQSPFDKLIPKVPNTEWLFPKLKFTMLQNGEDFLGIVP